MINSKERFSSTHMLLVQYNVYLKLMFLRITFLSRRSIVQTFNNWLCSMSAVMSKHVKSVLYTGVADPDTWSTKNIVIVTFFAIFHIILLSKLQGSVYRVFRRNLIRLSRPDLRIQEWDMDPQHCFKRLIQLFLILRII